MQKVLVLLTFLLGSLYAEESSDARLLVSKFLLSTYAVEGKEFVVDYNVYNVGEKPALQVSLVEEGFGSDYFEVIRGLLKVKWDRIPPGANISHSVVLKPKVAGRYNFTSAVISYLPSEDATEQRVGLSTAPGDTNVYYLKDYERKFSPRIADWGLFVLMTLPSLAMPYCLWYRSKSRYDLSKDRRYKKLLSEECLSIGVPFTLIEVGKVLAVLDAVSLGCIFHQKKSATNIILIFNQMHVYFTVKQEVSVG